MEAERKKIVLLQLVSFDLDKEVFAVDVMKVRGVERMTEITSIPGMPDFVEGVINLRDTIIPVVDLRRRFKLHTKNFDKETRIMLVELRTEMIVGMIVDMVHEVLQISEEFLGKVPRLGKTSAQVDKSFIQGVAKKESKLIIVLDVEKVFSEEEEEAMSSL